MVSRKKRLNPTFSFLTSGLRKKSPVILGKVQHIGVARKREHIVKRNERRESKATRSDGKKDEPDPGGRHLEKGHLASSNSRLGEDFQKETGPPVQKGQAAKKDSRASDSLPIEKNPPKKGRSALKGCAPERNKGRPGKPLKRGKHDRGRRTHRSPAVPGGGYLGVISSKSRGEGPRKRKITRFNKEKGRSNSLKESKEKRAMPIESRGKKSRRVAPDLRKRHRRPCTGKKSTMKNPRLLKDRTSAEKRKGQAIKKRAPARKLQTTTHPRGNQLTGQKEGFALLPKKKKLRAGAAKRGHGASKVRSACSRAKAYFEKKSRNRRTEGVSINDSPQGETIKKKDRVSEGTSYELDANQRGNYTHRQGRRKNLEHRRKESGANLFGGKKTHKAIWGLFEEGRKGDQGTARTSACEKGKKRPERQRRAFSSER